MHHLALNVTRHKLIANWQQKACSNLLTYLGSVHHCLHFSLHWAFSLRWLRSPIYFIYHLIQCFLSRSHTLVFYWKLENGRLSDRNRIVVDSSGSNRIGIVRNERRRSPIHGRGDKCYPLRWDFKDYSLVAAATKHVVDVCWREHASRRVDLPLSSSAPRLPPLPSVRFTLINRDV